MIGYRSSSKGQFFVLGGILVVLAIYLLSGTLQSGKGGDPSFVQDNEAVWIMKETEKGLYRIAMDNLTDELNIVEFVEMQKKIALESGYSMSFDMAFNAFPDDRPFPIIYSMSIESSDQYYSYELKSIPYYWECREADEGGTCDILEMVMIDDYPDSCCKGYGYCC